MQVVCFGTKYKTKNKTILAYNADPVTLLSKFWKRERICQAFGFIYFKVTKFKTVSFNETFQSYGIYRNINNSTKIITTTNLSVIIGVNHKQLWIMGIKLWIKYSLRDSINQHLQENNPLLHDLWSLSQSRELSLNSNKQKWTIVLCFFKF